MRLLALLAAGLFAGSLIAADDKISKPAPKDMKGDAARPYAGTKVEVKGRLSNYGVDKGTNKWFFHLTLIDDKGNDTTVTIYLFFDDKDAAAGLKGKLEEWGKDKKVVPIKDRPVAVVRGICELYAALDPKAKIPPVILNGTEIVEVIEKNEDKKGKDEEAIVGTWKAEKFDDGSGKELPAELVAQFRFTFKKDGKLTVANPGGKEKDGEYKLDPAAKTKAIDILVKGDKDTIGVYELDGDTLKISMIADSKTRPTEFKASGKGTFVMTLKRVKDEKKDK
jgi:uncharacterized protein (TIGR03067 family)